MKKSCKRLIKKNSDLKKSSKGMEINYMSNRKDMIILLIAGLMKRILQNEYFPPYKSSGRNIKVELNLSSYATKTGLKNVTHVDVSSFASKANLASLKTEVDKLNIDKLANCS